VSWQIHTQIHHLKRGWWLVCQRKNGKFKEAKTPGGKKLKVLHIGIGIGIVTCSPANVMLKSHHSNESRMLPLQLTSNVVFSIAKRLAFMGKHKVQCSPNPDPTKKIKTQLSTAGAAQKSPSSGCQQK
jgi:hypothetical protein